MASAAARRTSSDVVKEAREWARQQQYPGGSGSMMGSQPRAPVSAPPRQGAVPLPLAPTMPNSPGRGTPPPQSRKITQEPLPSLVDDHRGDKLGTPLPLYTSQVMNPDVVPPKRQRVLPVKGWSDTVVVDSPSQGGDLMFSPPSGAAASSSSIVSAGSFMTAMSEDGGAGGGESTKKSSKKKSATVAAVAVGGVADPKSPSPSNEAVRGTDMNTDSSPPHPPSTKPNKKSHRSHEPAGAEAASPTAVTSKPAEADVSGGERRKEAGPAPNMDGTPVAKSESQRATKPETKLEPKSEKKVEPKSETKPEPRPDLKPEPKPELKPELKPEPKPEPKPDLKPEPKPEPKPQEPKPQESNEVKSKPVPDVKPEPKPDMKADETPEPKPETSTDAKIDPKPLEDNKKAEMLRDLMNAFAAQDLKASSPMKSEQTAAVTAAEEKAPAVASSPESKPREDGSQRTKKSDMLRDLMSAFTEAPPAAECPPLTGSTLPDGKNTAAPPPQRDCGEFSGTKTQSRAMQKMLAELRSDATSPTAGDTLQSRKRVESVAPVPSITMQSKPIVVTVSGSAPPPTAAPPASTPTPAPPAISHEGRPSPRRTMSAGPSPSAPATAASLSPPTPSTTTTLGVTNPPPPPTTTSTPPLVSPAPVVAHPHVAELRSISRVGLEDKVIVLRGPLSGPPPLTVQNDDVAIEAVRKPLIAMDPEALLSKLPPTFASSSAALAGSYGGPSSSGVQAAPSSVPSFSAMKGPTPVVNGNRGGAAGVAGNASSVSVRHGGYHGSSQFAVQTTTISVVGGKRVTKVGPAPTTAGPVVALSAPTTTDLCGVPSTPNGDATAQFDKTLTSVASVWAGIGGLASMNKDIEAMRLRTQQWEATATRAVAP